MCWMVLTEGWNMRTWLCQEEPRSAWVAYNLKKMVFYLAIMITDLLDLLGHNDHWSLGLMSCLPALRPVLLWRMRVQIPKIWLPGISNRSRLSSSPFGSHTSLLLSLVIYRRNCSFATLRVTLQVNSENFHFHRLHWSHVFLTCSLLKSHKYKNTNKILKSYSSKGRKKGKGDKYR